VAVTNIQLLDPLVAIGVALNIVWSGIGIVRRSVAGLMDASLSQKDQESIHEVIKKYQARGAEFHALRTRMAGAVKFISMHVLVPGDWSVERGHQLASQLEVELYNVLPGSCVFTHLEPTNTPASHDQSIYSEIDAK
jgi:divalent metal cation (Fe/Co/Zn/Cd) transporter